MSVTPTALDLTMTAGRVAVFTSWLWTPEQPQSVSIDVYTSSIEGKGRCLITRWGVWKLRGVGAGPGGMGVQAELFYDPGSVVSPTTLAYINSVFWRPPSKIQVEFSYPTSTVRELLDVNLV